jgi:hypothetical protein
MSEIQVGDRVRYPVTEKVGLVIKAEPPIFYVRFGVDDYIWLGSASVELVERAWYAPPGVPMVALTPERIKALQIQITDVYHTKAEFQDADDIVRAMLAEVAP